MNETLSKALTEFLKQRYGIVGTVKFVSIDDMYGTLDLYYGEDDKGKHTGLRGLTDPEPLLEFLTGWTA